MTKKEKEILFKKESKKFEIFQLSKENLGENHETTLVFRGEWNSIFELINDLGLYEESYEWRLKNVKNK